METKNPHIVVLGAGFGGLTFCQTFDHRAARVTLLDRQNHHVFQPLLYQVKFIRQGRVDLGDGETLFAENIIWAAGVSASPLTQTLGVELDRAGRVKVNPDLSLPDHPEVFAIGDMALVLGADGRPVPGVSPAAMQMARHVARMIACELVLGGNPPRPPFRYRDTGTMATIGRSAAVARIGRYEFSGYPAWLAWLGVHLIFLIGFRNKLAVLLQWAYAYFTYKRGARIITGLADETKTAKQSSTGRCFR